MNLKALTYAVEVARAGSFTLAAQRLHIAQSALSMAISRLEAELDVPMFNRAGKKIRLTAEGARFLGKVEHLLTGLNHARQEVTDLSQLRVGEVRLGFAPMFGMGPLPQWLEAFNREYPGVQLTAIEGGGKDVCDRLESREVDLGLMDARRVEDHWASVPVASDELLLCVHARHPLAAQKSIQPTDLIDLPMVVLDKRFSQRVVLDEYCKPRQIDYRIVMQSNSAALVVDGAQRGMGATTLFHSNLKSEMGLIGIPFSEPQVLNFRLCWQANDYLSLANRRFVEFVQEMA